MNILIDCWTPNHPEFLVVQARIRSWFFQYFWDNKIKHTPLSRFLEDNYNKNKDTRTYLVIHKILKDECEEFIKKNKTNITFIYLDEKDLGIDDLDNFYDIVQNINLSAVDKFSAGLRNYLLSPDIVITMYLEHALRHTFASSLVLNLELTMTSRKPFNRAFVLTHHSLYDYKNCYLEHAKIASKGYAAAKFIANIRNNFLQYINSDIRLPYHKFEKIILYPFGKYQCDRFHTPFDQIYKLEEIIKKIPSNYGIAISFHPDYRFIFGEDVRFYLKNNYKNLIFFDDNITNLSLKLIPQVDAVITSCSSIGMIASFLKKPLFTTQDTYLTHIAEGRVEEIKHWFDYKQTIDQEKKDIIFTYMFRNIFIPWDLAAQKMYLYNIIANQLDSFKKGKMNDYRVQNLTDQEIEKAFVNIKLKYQIRAKLIKILKMFSS